MWVDGIDNSLKIRISFKEFFKISIQIDLIALIMMLNYF